MLEPYVYKATLERVIDGDTFELLVDLGFKSYQKITLRLADVDCPEMNTDAGKLAKAWSEEYLTRRRWFYIRTRKTGTGKDKRSFIRYVADIWLDKHMTASLADRMVECEIAKKV